MWPTIDTLRYLFLMALFLIDHFSYGYEGVKVKPEDSPFVIMQN